MLHEAIPYTNIEYIFCNFSWNIKLITTWIQTKQWASWNTKHLHCVVHSCMLYPTGFVCNLYTNQVKWLNYSQGHTSKSHILMHSNRQVSFHLNVWHSSFIMHSWGMNVFLNQVHQPVASAHLVYFNCFVWTSACISMYMFTPRLLIIGIVCTPHDWLNKLYSFYISTILGIVSRYSLNIDVHLRNQPNKSKLAIPFGLTVI